MVPVNNPGGGNIYNPVAGLAEGSEGLILLEVMVAIEAVLPLLLILVPLV